MKTSWPIRMTITGSVLMITGVLLTNINMRLPIVNEFAPDSSTSQLFIGITLIIIGFIIFSKSLRMIKRRSKLIHRKPVHMLLEVFGL